MWTWRTGVPCVRYRSVPLTRYSYACAVSVQAPVRLVGGQDSVGSPPAHSRGRSAAIYGFLSSDEGSIENDRKRPDAEAREPLHARRGTQAAKPRGPRTGPRELPSADRAARRRRL